MFDLEVYPNAEHGFDGGVDGDPVADSEAREDAQARSLAKLAQWL